MNILSFISGAIVGAAGTYTVMSRAGKKEKPAQPPAGGGYTAGSRRTAEAGPVQSTRTVQDTKPVARLVMQREIMRFNDLLEPLYMISQKAFSLEDSLATLEEWERRLSDLADADNLIKKWETTAGDYKGSGREEVSNIAFRWMNQLASFEISRDNRNEVQVNETVRRAYDGSGEEPLADGERMLVKSAAWFRKSDVIRRGILTKEGI